MIFVDDGIADHEHAVIADAVDQLQKFVETAILAQRIEMLADMRFEDVEVAVDQFRRAERHFVGEMDSATVRFDRVALDRDLACDIALRVLVVLALDIDAWADFLDVSPRRRHH